MVCTFRFIRSGPLMPQPVIVPCPCDVRFQGFTGVTKNAGADYIESLVTHRGDTRWELTVTSVGGASPIRCSTK